MAGQFMETNVPTENQGHYQSMTQMVTQRSEQGKDQKPKINFVPGQIIIHSSGTL